MSLRPTTASVRAVRPQPRRRKPLVVRLIMNPLGAITMLFLLFVVILGVFAPLIAPAPPNVTDLNAVNAPPFSPGHLLGADQSGRDVFSRLVWGTQPTIIGALIVLIVSVAIGVTGGLLAGFFRGRLEAVGNFFTDVIMSLPGIVLLIALYTLTGPNIPAAMAVFGILVAPTYFRLVRAVVVGVRGELYVDAARVVGLSNTRIIGRHVLWAVRGPVIIQSAFIIAAGIGIQAGVDFLGLGNPSQPSWGTVMQDAFNNIYNNPIGVWWPALLISLTILCLVLLGNVLRDELQSTGVKPLTVRQRRHAVDRSEPSVRAVPRGDYAIAVRGLRVGYPESDGHIQEVVHGVDLVVRKGEIHGLVGESGSGKSQIAFSTLGILPKEAVTLGGSIWLDGEDLLADPKRLVQARGRRIGYVPQEPMSNLDPSFTIGAQLTYGLRAVKKISKVEARRQLLALLARVGIREPEQVFKMFPHEISGGMAQRVLICGAVAADPEIIVADEATTALDVTVQAEVLELLRELSRERGLAMIQVTHNLGVVADLCDVVSVMRDGRIVEEAKVDDLFESPKEQYTKELLASSRSVEIIEEAS
ncbi:dipeptide/oligopeptide/nickel ABC transporter permease/ATP-binding protein [Diaminobutyricibacter tongyongensis]|uniref:Dipeptide/oligopeptide/nickel ABC transporter permease/ATP-binding protein n=1 Tax=Leifsonia tongyongensis TaxID=1268043 RepID=A0A6L9XUI8_9MICO|nr:dipeptide/oligopeptide/nickel ABC transporter permease/ATP-binding protein [Diaminobutyricibacter tongyongensis]NEN04947.1 dipeptide/oligopeptide/nickel ABC transporter permease/ATP-binding protein [Diaminobutyricibacter tongyongensis]